MSEPIQLPASVFDAMSDAISTELAIAFEEANMARHRAEQKALAHRYHPKHAAQFISSLAVREEIHSRRLAALYAQMED